MKLVSASAMLGAVAVCCGITATSVRAQSVENQRTVTFELTSLTPTGMPLQHGILNFVTLSMVEVGGSKTISIDDVPAFPLLATLKYGDRDGAQRETTLACDYRC